MFIISLGLLAPFFATAQEEQTTQQTPQENEKQYPATIEGQYDQLVEKAGNWEKYKLIKKESIYSFKRFMLDSLKAQKQVLREKLDTISSQSSQIKQLNQKITSLESDLDKEKNRNNSRVLRNDHRKGLVFCCCMGDYYYISNILSCIRIQILSF